MLTWNRTKTRLNGSSKRRPASVLNYSELASRQMLAQVTWHKIAHNLGLEHIDSTTNCLSGGDRLNSSQRTTILYSSHTVPIYNGRPMSVSKIFARGLADGSWKR
jgi:hypothetical protein